MRQINIQCVVLTLLTLILLMTIPSGANVNIVVQSMNNKTINLVNIDNNMTVTQFTDNSLISVPFDNYIVDIHTGLQSFTLNAFWYNLSAVQRDVLGFFLIFVSIGMVFFFAKLIKIQAKGE